MSRIIYDSVCRVCGHDDCHGLSQMLPCERERVAVAARILGGIYKPWCTEHVPKDNLEYLEYKYEKKSQNR
jgi:hypothetical protein